MKYSYNFGDKKKNNNKKVILIVIILLILVIASTFIFKNSSNKIISSISSAITLPFHLAYDAVSSLFSNISLNFGDVKKIKEEKQKLEEDKRNLELRLLESQRIIDENESLKKMLDIKKSYQHFDLKIAKIIYREHDNWTQTFKIDIGLNDGIKLNQAVIHKNGLVGYISKVYDNSAMVTTILDPSTSVSVSISTINEPAILQGDLSLKAKNKLKLTFIPLDTEVSISDVLYTSGLGETYPSAIPVGKIVEVVKNKNDINRYALVEPNVNITTIKEVAIII